MDQRVMISTRSITITLRIYFLYFPFFLETVKNSISKITRMIQKLDFFQRIIRIEITMITLK